MSISTATSEKVREAERETDWNVMHAKQVTIAKLKLETATAETAAILSQDKSCWRLTSNDRTGQQIPQLLRASETSTILI